MEKQYRVGIISDTHGLMRKEALQALENSDLILHAGDIGKPEILEALERIAPIVAVRGNVDREMWAQSLPERRTVEFAEVKILLLHNVKELAPNAPELQEVKVVVSGHSHQPGFYYKHNILWLNPGSAGPRRFKLPISLALLNIQGEALDVQAIELKI